MLAEKDLRVIWEALKKGYRVELMLTPKGLIINCVKRTRLRPIE